MAKGKLEKNLQDDILLLVQYDMGSNKVDKVYGLEKSLKVNKSRQMQYLCTAALLIFSLLSLVYQESIFSVLRIGSMRDRVQKCSISNFRKNPYFLQNSKPITAGEFIERRNVLARALNESGFDAFALEPGYSFQYYGNISQIDWEPWEPEERPFLMVVKPVLNGSTGVIQAETTFLSPAFEAGRVRMLGIPSAEDLRIIEWEEYSNPYDTLKKNLFPGNDHVTIMVDEEMRDFIVRGLDANGFKTQGLNAEVDMVRQVKSPAEIENLRAVNTGTIEAIRAMQPCLKPGLTERDVITILDNTLLSIGFELFFNIVLFDANAALPHGGFETGDKVLQYETMVLIDVGAHYLGYSSDICRSFFINPKSRLDRLLSIFGSGTTSDEDLYAEKIRVWDIVFEAQTEAGKMFKPGNSAASVDIAARDVIDRAGYDGKFTHRLGHGIGIKAHESPYLDNGNHQSILRSGMTFTNEPGIYLEGKFGVRHEDIYLVKDDGEAEVISGRRAISAYEP